MTTRATSSRHGTWITARRPGTCRAAGCRECIEHGFTVLYIPGYGTLCHKHGRLYQARQNATEATQEQLKTDARRSAAATGAPDD